MGAAKQGLQIYANDENEKHVSDHHTTSWQMIKALRVHLEEIAGSDREGAECGFTNIDSRHVGGIKNRVKEIFQQHEYNIKRGEITGAGNLKALDDVSQVIAEALADGTIDAYALVNLVGDGKVVAVEKGKKTIHVAVAESQIASLRDKLGACFAPDPQEFYAHFDSPDVMKESLKKHLDEMQGVERACFVSLFSDGVLKAAGMKQEEIIASRKQAHSHMYKLVAANIRELAEKSQDKLTKLQIKEEDVDALIHLADEMAMGNKKAIKDLVDGHGRILLQNILGVAALQELQTDKNAWTERMKAKPAAEKEHNGHHSENEDMSKEEHRPHHKTHNGRHSSEDIVMPRNNDEHWSSREQKKNRRTRRSDTKPTELGI